MNILSKATNVCRGLKQRWGSSATKHALWDQEYDNGRWRHCEETPDAPIYQVVQKYSRGGAILDLGCGAGNTANELDFGTYEQYTGVDISAVALRTAATRSEANGRAVKNRFAQGDIASFRPEQKYDVILFRESLYYIPQVRIRRVLQHYSSFLTPTGVFIVNVGASATKNPRDILRLIERSFEMVEVDAPEASTEFTAVFRPTR